MVSKQECEEHSSAKWNGDRFRCEIDGKPAKKLAGVIGKPMPPTQDHRPVMWENMLGGVNAMNEDREVEYFDYDYEDAAEFGGVDDGNDVRIGKKKRNVSYSKAGFPSDEPPSGKPVVWIVDE